MLSLQGLSASASKPAAPRISTMTAAVTTRIMDLFRDLGGTVYTPLLRPGSWDLAFTNGLVIELDEELHTNRYRQPTLDQGLPWSEDYAVNAVSRGAECLAVGRWGRRWSHP
jgi:hypothetical protein